MPSEITMDRAEIARIRKQIDRETRDTVRRRENEYRPLWDRIGLRRIENSFGAEYELSLTLKK